ncbi:MAG: TetR/AcrR family transcriptional regulator [Candidatus Dadabacteria bacterium]|nr:MAG: TetR/AcrR family transcriptional regulator [Candidatus Dadabacteria bacterium]
MDKCATPMTDSRNLEARTASPAEPDEAGPKRKRRVRSSKATRAQILEAALREFAEQGYEGATTASIARRVGVTQPLVHYHFGSKEALWKAACNSIFERLTEHLRQNQADVAAMSSAPELVTQTYHLIDFIVAHPELPRLLVNEGVTKSPRLHWLVETHLRPLFSAWDTALDEAKRAGLIKDIPNAFVLFTFLGACYQLFDLAPLVREVYGFDPRDEQQVQRFANALIEIFLAGISREEGEEDDSA